MIGESYLENPCAMFNALFLIEHVKNHILREGISFSHVFDWLMFKQNYSSAFDINQFVDYCKQFTLSTFVQSMDHLAEMIVLGNDHFLNKNDKLLLNDILADRVSLSAE